MELTKIKIFIALSVYFNRVRFISNIADDTPEVFICPIRQQRDDGTEHRSRPCDASRLREALRRLFFSNSCRYDHRRDPVPCPGCLHVRCRQNGAYLLYLMKNSYSCCCFQFGSSLCLCLCLSRWLALCLCLFSSIIVKHVKG